MPYTLDYNERIALASAMKLVLFNYDITTQSPEVVLDQMLHDRNFDAWRPFEHYSVDDLYNIIWQFQETIYEAMCASNFTQGIRSEF
jgi:hypothetical protein